ncbi:hypothetical protein HPB51_000386 [Rhipicephalus microplus]|uniref:Uncharacterized protein n=1 Tax=Rhipicephalus microplus TaxID=6941 RepID=A0A9J6E4L5_RHIMP|nr:hypothetical protein HPB51_000386 [Rhipicephalus microplus]
MSLKHAWLILQMVPLVLSAPTSTDKVPALPRLSPTASRDVIGANLWNWKTSVTSPCEEDIKPRPLQRHLSGSGGTTAAMSLEHAWLILQIPGYLSWKDLGYMSEVHSSSRCAVNVWGAVFMASSFLLFSLPAQDFPATPHLWPQFVDKEYDQRSYYVRPPEPTFHPHIKSTEYGAATSSTVTSRRGCDLKSCDYRHHPNGHGGVMTAGTAHALRFYVMQVNKQPFLYAKKSDDCCLLLLPCPGVLC